MLLNAQINDRTNTTTSGYARLGKLSIYLYCLLAVIYVGVFFSVRPSEQGENTPEHIIPAFVLGGPYGPLCSIK